MTSEAVQVRGSNRQSTGSNHRSKSADRVRSQNHNATGNNNKYGRLSTASYVNHTQRASNPGNSNRKCYKCGYMHNFSAKCPAHGRKCAKCGVLNYFANQCRNRNVNFVNNSNDIDIDDMFSGSIDTIYYVSTKNRKQWNIELLVENNPVNYFKIDTGAEINVLNQKVFDSLGKSIKLVETKVN